jgi:tripartite-type tricarboxylate transporter receptor subunit TctC
MLQAEPFEHHPETCHRFMFDQHERFDRVPILSHCKVIGCADHFCAYRKILGLAGSVRLARSLLGTGAMNRRKILQLAAGTAALAAMARVNAAQSYPTRPVRVIVGYAAGGVSDILARLMGQKLSQRLGQPFLIENRPGAGSNIGTELVVLAPPDGHTLLLTGVANAINATLYSNLSFNFIRDIAPVAIIDHGPLVLEVHPSVPVTTVPEFIDYAKANPGKINMASGGIGGATHVAGELFKMMTGINMVHVPYHGSASALPDFVAGQVQVMFDNMASSIELIRSGRLRPLGVTTIERSPQLPDIPSISDFVPGYEASGWNGVGAPKNCPSEIVLELNQEINRALTDPKIEAQLADLGGTIFLGSPAEAERFIVEDTERWARVIKFAGIKPV